MNTATLKKAVKGLLGPVVRAWAAQRHDLPPATWGLRVEEGRLHHGAVDLPALRAVHGSPLHVVMADRLERNVEALAAPEGAGAALEVFYSYKTNPVPALLRFLHARGVGAEVISHYELWLALRLGVPAEQIVFNGPAKSDEALSLAIEQGLLLLNANHLEELERIAFFARKLGKRPRVGIRVSTPFGWGGQFGVPIEGGQALAAFRAARARPELQVVGVHSHLGASIADEATLARFAGAVLDFTDALHAESGEELELIDFGGSLCIPTVRDLGPREGLLNRTFLADLVPPEPAGRLTLERYAQQLVAQVVAHFKARSRPVPRIFCEPGRALTGDAQLLLASVVETRDEPSGVRWAVLDAGVNLADAVRSSYHQLYAASRMGDDAALTHRLVGPICTPGDVLYPAWQLPPLRVGDALAIMDAGAYFVPFATSFSFPQPAIVMVEEGKIRPLRRAERFEDLVVLDEG